MMTIERFNKIQDGAIFLTGELLNEPGGLYMTDFNKGKSLTWVAKKGYGDDWCIYCYWGYWSYEDIAKSGDKVIQEDHIRMCVPCDDKVFSRYRY